MMGLQASNNRMVWGWARLVLGLLQIGLSIAAAIQLVQMGLEATTWFLIVGATAATCVSRLLYRGRPGPG